MAKTDNSNYQKTPKKSKARGLINFVCSKDLIRRINEAYLKSTARTRSHWIEDVLTDHLDKKG